MGVLCENRDQNSLSDNRLDSLQHQPSSVEPETPHSPGGAASETELLIAEVLAAMKSCRVSELKECLKNDSSSEGPGTESTSSKPGREHHDQENNPSVNYQSYDMEDERAKPRYRYVADLYRKTAVK